MQVSNFRDYEIVGKSFLNRRYKAKVDITTGILWWKKTESREIFRDLSDFWRFAESGQYVPGLRTEALEAAYCAKHNIDRLAV